MNKITFKPERKVLPGDIPEATQVSSISDAGEAMARRRRAFSSHYCSSASLPVDLVCFEERTSSDCFNFAQNRRRRFTDFKSGVSLVTSDADLLRTFSLLPTAAVGSFSEPSDLKLNGESMVLVAKVPGSFQIWRACSPTSVFLLFVVDRDLFSVHNRSSTHQSLQSSAVSTAWTTSHHALHSHATRISLGCQVSSVRRRHGRHVPELGQTLWKELFSFWAWPINNFIKFSLMGSFGSWPSWRFCLASPNSLIVSLHHPSDSLTCCLHRHLAPPPLLVPSASSSVRVGDSTKVRSLPSSSWLKERIIMSLYLSLRTVKLKRLYLDNYCIRSPPRYQISSCRGQREFAFPILLLEGEKLSTIFLDFKALVCCACVARSFLELEGGSSETLLSDFFKGSAKWCIVTPAEVADFMIVISVLVAVPIANNRSLCVLFVSQGIVPLCSSKFVRVRRLLDDIYGLSVKIACIYPVIFHVCVFRLPFEAAMACSFPVVTIFSFFGAT